jgi:hypothetical protein
MQAGGYGVSTAVSIWIRFGAYDVLLACAHGPVAWRSSTPNSSILNSEPADQDGDKRGRRSGFACGTPDAL